MNELRSFLQGRFLGHPIHPLLVHFPLVLVPVAIVFDILSLTGTGGQSLFVQSAFYALLVGVVMGALAAFFGIIDFVYEIPTDHPARATATIHASGQTIFLVTQIISLGLRGTELSAGRTPVAPFVLTIVGALVMLAMSWLGGRLVYKYGIRVEPVEPGPGTRAAPHPREPLPENVRRFPGPRFHLRRKK